MRPSLVLVLVLALASSCSSTREREGEREPEESEARPEAPDSDGEAALAARIRAQLLEALPGASVLALDEDTLAIVRNGVTAELELAPVQQQCRAHPDRCATLIERLVEAVREAAPGEAAAITREQVRAVIHGPAWMREAGPDTLVWRPFVGELSIVYVLDFPSTIESLTRAQRFELAIGTDESLHALALENMARDLADFPTEPLGDEAPGVFALRAGDSYEAARVLLLDRWADIAARVEGDLVIGIPSRDLVLFAGSARRAHVTALRRNTEHLASTLPNPIAPTLLRYTPSGWELFE